MIKPSTRCEHIKAGGKAQTSRDNTSEDYIFCDGNSTLADSNVTFSGGQDLIDSRRGLEGSECKLE
jgi:hypothetical protein